MANYSYSKYYELGYGYMIGFSTHPVTINQGHNNPIFKLLKSIKWEDKNDELYGN